MERRIMTVVDNDLVKASLEFLDDDPYLHLEVHKWSKELMSNLQILFDSVVEKCEDNDISILSFYGTDPKIIKLAHSFAPPDFVEMTDEGYYVGGWYIK